mmetsp:Transcript_23837/g.38261  ORF Transcript_23837/g.38261 Transcript_23837/m.38261 type:complete len:240 (+) Transcript_23837:452-1171(+)
MHMFQFPFREIRLEHFRFMFARAQSLRFLQRIQRLHQWFLRRVQQLGDATNGNRSVRFTNNNLHAAADKLWRVQKGEHATAILSMPQDVIGAMQMQNMRRLSNILDMKNGLRVLLQTARMQHIDMRFKRETSVRCSRAFRSIHQHHSATQFSLAGNLRQMQRRHLPFKRVAAIAATHLNRGNGHRAIVAAFIRTERQSIVDGNRAAAHNSTRDDTHILYMINVVDTKFSRRSRSRSRSG